MFDNNNDSYATALEKIKKARHCQQLIIGPTGPTGEAPSLTIGTVTTGAPGTDASASITGTSPNFILNLTIPRGPTGPTS